MKKLHIIASALVTAGEMRLPLLKTGDVVMVGKFKNRKAIITGFAADKNGQPVVKTDKGDYAVFKFRLAKLLPENK